MVLRGRLRGRVGRRPINLETLEARPRNSDRAFVRLSRLRHRPRQWALQLPSQICSYLPSVQKRAEWPSVLKKNAYHHGSVCDTV